MAAQAAVGILQNIYFWMGMSFLFLLLTGIFFILLIMLAKKTHAIIEFKAWMSGRPIALFFQENRNVDWKAVKNEAGIIDDPDYGSFIINERATYVDKKTRNVMIPFDVAVAPSINVHAAKLLDDLQYIVKDDEELKKFRYAIAHNMIDENASINSVRTSVHFGAVKSMMTAMIPHAIAAKIEKVIAQRLKGVGKVNIVQIIFIFVAMLGAIVIGALLIKMMGNKA
jgi:hypothetical protein